MADYADLLYGRAEPEPEQEPLPAADYGALLYGAGPEPASDGAGLRVGSPLAPLAMIPRGFNRALGNLVGGFDLLTSGAMGLTPEDEARRRATPSPLGYVGQVLRGERAVPGIGGYLYREPTTAAERAFTRGGEVLAESLGPVGATAALGRAALQPAASATGRALQTLIQGQAARPATTAAAEAAGAVGSGVGEQIGREQGGSAGAVVGGLVGGLAPGAATLPLARRAGGKALAVVRDAVSPDASARRAREFVAGELGPQLAAPGAQAGLARAEALRRQVPGFAPDLAQATGSEALRETKAGIIRNASGADLEQLRGRDAASRAAIERYAREHAPAGEPVAEAAFEPLIQERRQAAAGVRALQQQAEALPKAQDLARTEAVALRQLQERTAGARKAVAGRMQRIDRGEAGKRIREGIKAERQARMAGLNQMAKDLGIEELSFGAPFRQFARNVGTWRAQLLPSQAGNMPGVVGDIEALARRSRIGFKDVKALRESAVDEVLEAAADTSPGHRKRLANAIQIRGMIDDQLLGAGSEDPFMPDMTPFIERARAYAERPDLGEALRQAQARQRKKPFRTLGDFVVEFGGLSEEQALRGELRARDITASSRPGLIRNRGFDLKGDATQQFGKRQVGRTVEDAAHAAWEAGYFPGNPERPSPDEFLNALDDDLTGVQPRYSQFDQAAADAFETQRQVNEDMARAFDDLGIDWEKAKPEDIRAQIDQLAQDSQTERLALADRYRQFRKAYFDQIIEPFERGTVFKATRKDGTGFYRTLDEDVALEFLQSADAAEQIGRIARTQPGMLATLEAVALDDLASAAVVNGVISPRGLERWLEQHRAALAQLPNVRGAVVGVAKELAEIEGRYRAGRQIITQRKQAEIARISGERDRLQQAMQPLLQRMGALSERKMALEDTMLARRLAAIERGSQDPATVIDQAVKNPALMRRLWTATAGQPEAQASLRRHLWDELTVLDGQTLGHFLDENAASLRIAFGAEHLERVGMIRDGLAMLEFAPSSGRAQPIRADLLTKIERATGLKPAQMASRYLGIQRGRSSKFVESFDTFMRWLGARNQQAIERLTREALFNPEVATALVESMALKLPTPKASRLEQFATRRLRGWLWRLGIMAPTERATEERNAP